MENFTQYYGLDLLAMCATFLGVYFLGNKNKYGFLLHFVGNLLWFGLGFLTQSLGLIIANVLFSLMNIRGFILWRRKKN